MKELMEIKQEYDCYFIDNKYGDEGTHKEQFDKLRKLLKDDEMSQKALTWIEQCYDYYYVNDFKEENDNNPFYYLEKKNKGDRKMKNKEITIYELLGLIKDNKAPEQIESNDSVWNYEQNMQDYFSDDKEEYLIDFIRKNYCYWLIYYVDIVEEKPEIEFEDIKELNAKQEYTDKGNLHDYLYYQDSKYALSLPQKLIIDNQNKIIRNQKKIIDKLEKVIK